MWRMRGIRNTYQTSTCVCIGRARSPHTYSPRNTNENIDDEQKKNLFIQFGQSVRWILTKTSTEKKYARVFVCVLCVSMCRMSHRYILEFHLCGKLWRTCVCVCVCVVWLWSLDCASVEWMNHRNTLSQCVIVNWFRCATSSTVRTRTGEYSWDDWIGGKWETPKCRYHL